MAPNVIATSVRIMGSVRTFTAPVKRMVQLRLREIAQGIAASHGPRCSIVVQFHDGCDSVYFSYEVFHISVYYSGQL